MKVKDIVNKFTWNTEVKRIVFRHCYGRTYDRALTPREYDERKLGRYHEADGTVTNMAIIDNELIIYYR